MAMELLPQFTPQAAMLLESVTVEHQKLNEQNESLAKG